MGLLGFIKKLKVWLTLDDNLRNEWGRLSKMRLQTWQNEWAEKCADVNEDNHNLMLNLWFILSMETSLALIYDENYSSTFSQNTTVIYARKDKHEWVDAAIYSVLLSVADILVIVSSAAVYLWVITDWLSGWREWHRVPPTRGTMWRHHTWTNLRSLTGISQ